MSKKKALFLTHRHPGANGLKLATWAHLKYFAPGCEVEQSKKTGHWPGSQRIFRNIYCKTTLYKIQVSPFFISEKHVHPERFSTNCWLPNRMYKGLASLAYVALSISHFSFPSPARHWFRCSWVHASLSDIPGLMYVLCARPIIRGL